MTTNISKIQAALASVTQETTLALFNLNLDCSLIKVDAPKEYLPFGNALAKRRRTQAETGPAHRIARKLGMLFEGIVPQTPELIKAYGTRASEIIEFHEKQLSSKSSGKSEYGPFTDYIGVDGTTIWAAATSSGAAIAIHLLACLLAVAFTAEESVAIWEQIVEARKEEISRCESGDLYGLRTLAASTWDISRQDLAGWDASARAWIRSANAAKERQCSQLRLILDNIDLPVHTSVETYRSVIETWQACLKMMDALVQGNGQDVQNGGLFVAFRAWHIFPDLILLKNQKHVKQNDLLVKPGGIVTIGLERADNQGTSGVNWSLSLSHLQFYGDAERREGYLNSTKERVSIPEVWVFLLGFCFGLFGTNISQIERKIKIAITVSDLLIPFAEKKPLRNVYSHRPEHRGDVLKTSWIYRLNQASKRYSRCTDEERKRFRQLIALGCKSYRDAWEPAHPMSLRSAIENLMTSLGAGSRGGLCKFLKSFGNDTMYPLVDITYDETFEGEKSFERSWSIVKVSIGSIPDIAGYGKFPNPVLLLVTPKTTCIDGKALSPFAPGIVILVPDDFERDRRSLVMCDMAEEPKLIWGSKPPSILDQFVLKAILGSFKFHIVDSIPRLIAQEGSFRLLCVVLRSNPPEPIDIMHRNRRFHSPSRVKPPPPIQELPRVPQDYLKISDVELLLHKNLIDPAFIARQLASSKDWSRPTIQYFQDIAGISNLYEKFGNPLIDLSHLATCFTDRYSSLGKDPLGLLPDSQVPEVIRIEDVFISKELEQSAAFEWIHYLESKGQRIKDTSISLMAISSEDSLFVASQFLQDPLSSIHNPPTIVRLPGNIGRSGVILLVTPGSQRHPSHEDLLLEDAPFDGQLLDCFRDTTLHLTLTGYELPLKLEGGKSGTRHHETWVFEAATSVHAAGKWIGDINPLLVPDFHMHQPSSWVTDCIACEGKNNSYEPATQIQGDINENITSIDCWGEYFHRPSNATVFRAKNNWAARLAAFCLAEKVNAPIIPINPQTCKCRVEQLLRYPGPYVSNPGPNFSWAKMVWVVVGARFQGVPYLLPSTPKPAVRLEDRSQDYPIYLL
ncbi:hypothetical protein TWF718_004463 [Orbilia javanica]|uniref:Uncharacterized protein n=1 Tax=Orbilia javanica TaxID=47235 RepID=A0AAN8N658_9PEZI